jgi:hypothetical protein
MSTFKDQYPRLVYKASDKPPGFVWQKVATPDEAEALGAEWHDTPKEAIEDAAKLRTAEGKAPAGEEPGSRVTRLRAELAEAEAAMASESAGSGAAPAPAANPRRQR